MQRDPLTDEHHPRDEQHEVHQQQATEDGAEQDTARKLQQASSHDPGQRDDEQRREDQGWGQKAPDDDLPAIHRARLHVSECFPFLPCF